MTRRKNCASHFTPALGKKILSWDDPKLHELAGEFFRLFSRFEYALKAAEFLIPNRRNAEADWSRFAVEIHDALDKLESEELKKVIKFILIEPPKKQVNINGVVEWDKTPPDAKNQTDLLLQYVRRVRNNLFHGGKFNGRWFEPERSGPLIDSSITILNTCLLVSQNVKDAYHS